MRNGNFCRDLCRLRRCKVLTVPMRNGNSSSLEYPHPQNSVLTVPMRNGNLRLGSQSQGQHNVLTVPMRNGNTSTAGFTFRDSISVLTVPMRNGNWMACYLLKNWKYCSYRTYEEWKPLIDSPAIAC